MQEAHVLAGYISGEVPLKDFFDRFPGRASEGFLPERDLLKIGVVNQTTMLATETREITEVLRAAMKVRVGEDKLSDHFADTRDTLCYATNENQDATYALIEGGGHLALVVGGYNSSNTSHLVELLEPKFPTFYIKDEGEILGRDRIRHLSLHTGEVIESESWLPLQNGPIEIMITAGASCPDILVDRVITKVASFFGVEGKIAKSLPPTF